MHCCESVRLSQSSQHTNELELEHRDADSLINSGMTCAQAAARQEWTPYYDEVLIFLNNVRMIIRCVLSIAI